MTNPEPAWKSKVDVIRSIEYKIPNKVDVRSSKTGYWILHQFAQDGALAITFVEIGKERGSWYYTFKTESEGSLPYDCPISFLEKSKEFDPDWRNAVKAYNKVMELVGVGYRFQHRNRIVWEVTREKKTSKGNHGGWLAESTQTGDIKKFTAHEIATYVAESLVT